MNKKGTEKKTEKGMEIGTKIDRKKKKDRKNTHNRSEKRQKKSDFPVLVEETLGLFCMVVFDQPALGLFLHIADVVNFVPLKIREYLSR